MFRFYNAGSKIDELFPFSLPDGPDIHVLGKWSFVAPKQSWFEVPNELVLNSGATVAVKFAEDIRRNYGKRGVVMLDPRWNPEKEDEDKPLQFYPVAPTEEAVVARAEKLWDNYLEEICKAHFEDVQNAMSAGGAPRAARGYTARALKLKGYADPAERYFLAQKEKANGQTPSGISPEVAGMLAQMQQQNQAMMGLIVAIVSGQKLDPASVQNLMGAKPVAPVVTDALPETLEVEGQSPVSLEERKHRKGEYETLKSDPASRKDRAAAAAKAL
jgi:hypothetical protein